MNWKGLVGTVAPVLGSALGGPLGGMAGKFIGEALGVPETEVPEVVENADPGIMLKLKELDKEFETKIKELDIDLEKINQQDRESARAMARDKSMTPQIILSVVYTVAYAVVLWAFVTGRVEIAAEVRPQFSIVLGVLTASQAQILNFWFGSSSGSKLKTILGNKTE